MKKITYVLLVCFLLLTSCSNKFSLKKCLKDNIEYFIIYNGGSEEDIKYYKYSDEYNYSDHHMLKDVNYKGLIAGYDFILAVEYEEQENEQKIKENLINIDVPFDYFVYNDGYCQFDVPGIYVLLYGYPYKFNECLFVTDINNNDILVTFSGDSIISIPENIDYISGYLGFEDTDINIKHLKMNEDLKRIGVSAFWGCENLILIDLNEGLKEISSFAFRDSKQLKRVVIPSSVERIGKSAFVSGDIYCEAKSKPDNWDDEFVSGTAVVHWGDEWQYGKYGNPELIK